MEDILTIALRRADSYKFLSECYYLPDEEFITKDTELAQRNPLFAELADCISSDVEPELLRIDFFYPTDDLPDGQPCCDLFSFRDRGGVGDELPVARSLR